MRRVTQAEHRRAIALLHRLADKAVARALKQALDPIAAHLHARHETLTASAMDELTVFGSAWVLAVQDELLPMIEETFGLGALGAARQLREAVAARSAVTNLTPMQVQVSAARLRWLAASEPRWFKLGDEIWGKAKVELLEGITLGEGTDLLAARLESVVELATPLARAVAHDQAVASANAGSFAEVGALGMTHGPEGKQWLSTADGRTRESHADAHGQIQRMDRPFEVGADLLDFPGDPNGSPEEVAGCRCALIYVQAIEDVGPSELESITMELPTDTEAIAAAGAEPAPGCHCLTPHACECHTLTAAAEVHTGAMVALVPTEQDAQRLAVDGYEPADVLHCTLAFLGESGALPDVTRAEVLSIAEQLAADTEPIVANAHGIALFNAASDEPCAVYLLGDTDLLGPDGVPPIMSVHDRLWAELEDYGTEGFPMQHSPYVAHTAISYSDDLSLLTEAGTEVTFDRIRVAFGTDEVTDFALSAGTVVASEEEAMSVVTFTDEQRDEIRALVREGGMEALTAGQKLILSAVEAANTSTGTVTLAVDAPPPPAPVVDDAPPEDAPADTATPEEFHILMVTEEQSTLEKPSRYFVQDCFEWREPPFPLMWLNTDTHSEGAPAPSVQVGLITRVDRQGLELHSWGHWDDPVNLDAAEARRRVENGMLQWNSVDIGDVGEADIELVFPPPGTVAPDGIEVMEPEQVRFHHGRVVESTLVFSPAQENAIITPLIFADGVPTFESMGEGPLDDAQAAMVAAAYPLTIPDVPDAAWFEKPPLEYLRRGALTITDEGRVYGLLAPGAVPHVGLAERTTVPLRNVEYKDFLRGETPVRLKDGTMGRIVTGNLTMACGHAERTLPNGATASHYDNSCSLFATAVCGEAHGDVWVAGALLPGVEPDQVRRAMACQLSGHWNPHELARGRYSLLAGLLVPITGFPKGRTEATATTRWGPNDDGDLMLVASAVPVVFEHVAFAKPDLGPVAALIAKSVGLDRKSRAKALAARVGVK